MLREYEVLTAVQLYELNKNEEVNKYIFQYTIEGSMDTDEEIEVLIDQFNELNMANNKILIPLLYNSLINYFFNTHLKSKYSEISGNLTELLSATKELINIIQIKKNNLYGETEYADIKVEELKSENAYEIKYLISDLENLRNRLNYFFTLLKEDNTVDKVYAEYELTHYLEVFFREQQNNNINFQYYLYLIEEKNKNDKAIENLRNRISVINQYASNEESSDQLSMQQMQQMQQMQGNRPETNHLFVLVSHGASVNQFKTYIKTRAYFKNIEYMIPFGDELFAEDLQELGTVLHSDDPINDINTYLDRNRREEEEDGVLYKTNEIITSDDEYAYLPPMIFNPITHGLEPERTELYNSLMGLYHYVKVQETGHYVSIYKVADYQGLVNASSNGQLTYSTITKLVRDYFRYIRSGPVELISQDSSSIGNEIVEKLRAQEDSDIYKEASIIFHTCRNYYYEELSSKDDIYAKKDVLKNFNATVVIRPNPKPVAILDSINSTDGVSLLSIDIKNFNIEEAMMLWKGALVGLYNQGCGFNVLNFFNLLNTEEARDRSACLNIGTSIFDIADFIKDYLPINEIGVCRMPIENYKLLLQTVINNLVSNLSICSSFMQNSYLPDIVFLVRVYTKDKRDNSQLYNEVGHFISICIKNHCIYYIDPQSSIEQHIMYDRSYAMNDNTVIYDFLSDAFPEQYEFCDIYIYKNITSPLPYGYITEQYKGVLRQRTAPLTGGKRFTKTHKIRTRRTKYRLKRRLKDTKRNTQKRNVKCKL